MYSVPAVSLGVCSTACNDNQRCVAFNYRGVSKQCELFTQWDYRGDAVASQPSTKVVLSKSDTLGIRVGSATSFFGKVDYGALYSKNGGPCPADSERTLSGSESYSAGAPVATTTDPPLSCIYDSRCAVEVSANNGKPARRYVKVPTSKAANGSHCSFRRLHRPPKNFNPGAG
jgi:hypothetical protein